MAHYLSDEAGRGMCSLCGSPVPDAHYGWCWVVGGSGFHPRASLVEVAHAEMEAATLAAWLAHDTTKPWTPME